MKSNSYAQSLQAVLSQCRPLAAEAVSYRHALGRVLAEAVRADSDDPPAPKSKMDGFALRAADTRAATGSKPVTLKFSEVVGAGHVPRSGVAKGRAVRLMTGALLPKGADAVVKQEDTEPAGGGAFRIHRALVPRENVLPAGARMKKGVTLLEAGDVVGPAGVGLLAGLGKVHLPVRRQPRVVLLALGDELVEPGLPLKVGQLYVSNLHAIEAKVMRYGGRSRNLGIAADNPEMILRLLGPRLLRAGEDAAQPLAAEVIVTLGGSHGGDFDFAHLVMETLGATVHFRRTRLSLGGSTLFASLGDTLLFGLPGTPVPSLGAFELLVRPALWRLAGRTTLTHPTFQARLTGPVSAMEDRANFVPAWLEFPPGGLPAVTPLRDQGKSRPTRDATLANGLIEVPEGIARLPAGEAVNVQWLGE